MLLFKGSINFEWKIIEIHVRIVVCYQIQKDSLQQQATWRRILEITARAVFASYTNAKSAY